MKKNQKKQFSKLIYLGILLIGLFQFNRANAQALTGVKTIPGNYATIQAAVADLNINGVGTGGVIFNIAAGYTEVLTAPIVVSATGTVTNQIVFQKNGVGANPLITSFVGSQLASSNTGIDIMWSFIGSDYVTINQINLIEAAANTTPTTQMEVGIGFYKVSGTDGTNNNTVQNCTITLNRNNNTASTGPRANATGSVGIEVMACTPTAVGTTITVTSVAGASSNNKFYGNTIQNVNFGISLGGFAAPSPYNLADLNNDIGGASLATGNNIINFGGGVGATSQCGAVYIHNQWSFNISFNTVNNNNGSGVNHPVTNRGIWLFSSSVGASCNINNNRITISGGVSTSSIDWCLDFEMAQSGANGNIININNNQFLNCNKTAASTVAFTAIWLNTAATTVNCNNNNIYGFRYDGTGTSQCILSQLAGIGTLNINNNNIDSTILGGAAATGTHHNIGVTAAPLNTANMNGNIVTRTYLNTVGTGTKTLYGVFISATLPTININDNLVDSITRNGTTGGTTIGILQALGTNGTTTVTVKRNIVRNLSIIGTGATSTMYGIQTTTGTIICDSNTIFNLSCVKTTGISALYGIYNFGSPNNENFNFNNVYNLTHNGTGTLAGLFKNTATGVRNVSNNNIYNLVGGGAVVGISQTTSVPTVFNNKIYNLTTNSATAAVSGINLVSMTAGTAQIYNNIIGRLFAPVSNGAATATVIGINITNAIASTTVGLYNNTIHLNATSTGAAFSSAGILHTYNVTATTSSLDMRNNIVVNNSTPNGTGTAVAFRRTASTDLNNFNIISNRNLFYAGTPGTNNLIYFDGTNSDQTIAAYKARVAPRDSASVTENVNFTNITNGALNTFLGINSSIATEIEGAGRNIAGITTDYLNLIRAGNLGYIGTSGAPDLGALEGNYTGLSTNQMYFDSANADQVLGVLPSGSINNRILRVRVYAQKGANALNTTSFKLNTLGTTSVANITNAKIFYTGADSTFTAPALFGTTTSPSGSFYVTGNRTLALGVNYFWVTYDISNTAAAANLVDAAVDSITLNAVNYALINGDPSGNRTIQAPLNGNYNVGAGQTFQTITEAVNNLNLLGVSGPVTFVLKDVLYSTTSGEIFPITFSSYNNSTLTNKVTIRPDAGISARIASNNGTATFDLNGVSNLVIDGRQGGTGSFIFGNNLIIANTGTLAPAVRFINDADSNQIIYTDLRANNATATGSAGAGVVNFGTTIGTNGNDFNSIRFCDIHEETGGNPLIGISSIGSAVTVAANNDFNTIDSCNIYNFFNATTATAGLYIGSNNGNWTINGNRFYQTSTLTYTGAVTHRVMWITPNTGNLTSASGFVITNNFIGGNNNFGTGSYTITGAVAYSLLGADLSVGIGSPTSVQNNIINNINGTFANTGSGVLVGLRVANGNVNIGNVLGNTIGSGFTNSSIVLNTTVSGGGFIGIQTTGGNNVNISNTRISGIEIAGNTTTAAGEFFGMALSGANNITATNNIIGDTLMANSINHSSISATSTLASRMIGIIINPLGGTPIYNVTNNIIANINTNYSATGAQAATTKGISVLPTINGTYTVSGNLIRNLSSASQTTSGGATTALGGIAVNHSVGATVLNNNIIHSLTLTHPSTTAAVQNAGIFYSTPASGNNLITRNFIHSLSLISPNASAAFITGMDIAAGNGIIANNIIRLGIDSAGLAINTPCTYRGITKNSGSIGIYFNTVYIGGFGVTASNNRTFAFARTGAGTDDVRNNIFVNTRTSSSLSSANLAVNLSSNTALTMNFNVLNGDTVGMLGTTLYPNIGNWKSGSTVDVNSLSGLINFINETGDKNTVDLHINSTIPSPLEAYGTPVAFTGSDVDFDGQTRSLLTPIDLGADAGNFIPLDIASPSISYIALQNTLSTTNRTITATITDATGIYLTGALRPRIYFKKFFTGTWNSAQGTLVSGTKTNSIWNFVINSSTLGGLISDDSVYYYVVAQDSNLVSNLGSFPAGVEGTDVNTITIHPNAFGYKIIPSITGVFDVGVGQTFTTLTGSTGLFGYINNAVVAGDITIRITSDIEEPGTVGLNETVESGVGNYKINIVPNAAVLRSLTGNYNVFAAGLIRLSGADRVKIDGSFGGSGKYIRIMNRIQAGASIDLLNDADNDTITNCIIEGVTNSVGMLNFFGTNKVGGTGNDSNAVVGCIFKDTTGTISTSNIPNTGMFSQGTTGFGNDFNTFSNNQIYNFGFNGINLSSTSGDFWSITNNSFYQIITKNNGMTIILVNGGTGHNISGNSFGGSAPDRSGNAFVSSASITGIAIATTVNTSSPFTINNNTFSNIAATGTTNFLKCIAVAAGTATISNNVFGGGVNAYDTLRNAGDGAIIELTGGTATVSNNLLSDYRYYAGSTVYRHIGIYTTSGTHNIIGNTIRNIEGNNATATLGLYTLSGIYLNGGTNHIVRGNTISNIRNINTGTAAYLAAGVMVVSATTSTIERNRIFNISAIGGGAGTSSPQVIGIYTSSAGHTYLSNQISIGSNTTLETRVSAIRNVTTTGTSDYFYNSIYVGGQTSGGANNSFGVERTAAGTVNLMNNIIYNGRTTLGTGINYPLSSTNTINAANLVYNLLIGSDTSRIALLGGVAQGWAALNTLYTTTYNTNWAERASNVLANNLFIDTLVGNLGIVTSNPEAWYANGKGERITTVSGDFNNNTGVRSTTISGGAVDIGSVEFTPTSTPSIAFADKTPAANDSTQFFFGSRMVAKAVWGSAGTLPSNVDVKYYSGVNPSNTIANSTFMNAYWDMQATGGSGYSYDLTLMQDSAVHGTIGNLANLQVAKYAGTGTNWSKITATSVNNVTGFMNANSSNTMGIFTGTNGVSNSLPVKLIALTASAKNNNVLVSWTTASEENNKGFEVESSIDGNSFKMIGFVKGAVNSNRVSNYNLQDEDAFVNNASNVIYYRLKQLDIDGKFTYSKVVSVNNESKAENVFEVFPNPFNTEFNIVVNATEAGNAIVETIDLQGKVLVSKNFNTVSGLNTLNMADVANLNTGIYVVKVTVNGQTFVHKLVKN